MLTRVNQTFSMNESISMVRGKAIANEYPNGSKESFRRRLRIGCNGLFGMARRGMARNGQVRIVIDRQLLDTHLSRHEKN